MNRLHGQRPCDRAIGTGPVRANPAATHRLRHLEPVRPPVSPIFAARRRQERSETADAITCIYPAPPPGAEQRRPAPQRPRPAGHTPAVPDPICPSPVLHHHLHDMRHHCKENKPQTEFAAASSRPPTPSSRRDSSRYGDFPPPVSPQASSPPLPLSFSHLTMISRALKLQQRKAPGAPRSTARHGYVHVLFAVSSSRYPILFQLILVSYPFHR